MMSFVKEYIFLTKKCSYFTRHLFTIVLWQFIATFIFTGCDVCTNDGNSEEHQGDIYFTAQPLNSKTPSVFSVSIDGSKLREVIKNAVIFSGPSRNGQIAFLRYVEGRGNSIFVADANGKYSKFPLVDDLTFPEKVNNPIISYDGKWIGFISGSSVLNYREITKDINNQATQKMVPECQPTFSPVANLIAIFEKTDDEKIKWAIYSTELINNIPVLEKKLDITDENLIKPPIINWSSDGKFIIFSIRKDTADYIFIEELESNNDKVIVLDTSTLGAELPAFAPVNLDRISFTSKSGEIWIRNLTDSLTEYKKIVGADLTEVNRFSQWSPDGLNLLYHNYYVHDKGEYTATLILLSFDLNFNVKNQMIISNYVFRGFWRR